MGVKRAKTGALSPPSFVLVQAYHKRTLCQALVKKAECNATSYPRADSSTTPHNESTKDPWQYFAGRIIVHPL